MKIFLACLITLTLIINLYPHNKKFKISVIQIDEEFGDKEKNIQKLCYFCEEAAKYGANIILMPELCTSGYKTATKSWLSKDMIRPMAETIPGKTTNRFSKISKKYGCYIVLGMVELTIEDGNLYNSLCVINSDGDIETVYRKINLYTDDKRWAKKGNLGHKYFDTSYGRFGLMICFDMHFKNPVRHLVENNASYILFATAWDAPRPISSYWKAFAIKNDVFLFASDNAINGESCIITNEGDVLNTLDKGEEGFIIETINY